MLFLLLFIIPHIAHILYNAQSAIYNKIVSGYIFCCIRSQVYHCTSYIFWVAHSFKQSLLRVPFHKTIGLPIIYSTWRDAVYPNIIFPIIRSQVSGKIDYAGLYCGICGRHSHICIFIDRKIGSKNSVYRGQVNN